MPAFCQPPNGHHPPHPAAPAATPEPIDARRSDGTATAADLHTDPQTARTPDRTRTLATPTPDPLYPARQRRLTSTQLDRGRVALMA
ncbi:hypothetical protein DBP21_16000 [Streptomyces sp. CS147]|nr:hypothetical protein DBP21_16000 [Streptomyces sp. CS147]